MITKTIAFVTAISLQSMGFCAEISKPSVDSTGTPQQTAVLIHGIARETLFAANRSDSSEISLEYYYYAPVNEGNTLLPYQKTLNEIVYQNTLWNTFSSNDSNASVRVVNQAFFENQLDTLVGVYNDIQEEYEYEQIWSMDVYSEVTDHKLYVDLLIEEYNYLGGAHGNSSVVYYQIDRESGEVLGLSDFFTDLEAVHTVAESYFRESYGLEDVVDWEESDFWFSNNKFEVSEIFTLTGDTVTFHYNTYDIAPYYFGPIIIEVPLSALDGILTDYCIANL